MEACPDIEVDGVVRWRRADLATKVKAQFGVVVAERTMGKWLDRLNFRRLSAHPQQDADALEAHKKNFATLVIDLIPEHARGEPIEIRFQDEARVGQQGTLTQIWARPGSRPRRPKDLALRMGLSLWSSVPPRVSGPPGSPQGQHPYDERALGRPRQQPGTIGPPYRGRAERRWMAQDRRRPHPSAKPLPAPLAALLLFGAVHRFSRPSILPN